MARPTRSSMRWYIVAMAFLGTSINYIDRANLGVALPSLKTEFHLSPEMSGLILGAFFWTYASFQLPSGWFVDKVGPRIAYTVAVVWWSIFTSATAIARGFASMFGFRLLLGIGEAPAYPTNAKSVAEWFPKSERAFATAIYDSGARAGTVAALPLCTWIIKSWGWRSSFVITGIIGIVWSLVWYALYRHPSQHSMVFIEKGAPAGRTYTGGDDEDTRFNR